MGPPDHHRGPPPPMMMNRGYPPEPGMGFPDRDPRGPYGGPMGPGPGHGPPGPGPNGPMGFHGGPPPPSQGIGRHRSRRDEQPGISLLVRNICPEITVADLEHAFRRIGDVRDVYIPRDYHSRQPKRFAFVEYANQQEAARAKEAMDKFMMKGRELEVLFAQEKRKTSVQMKGRAGEEDLPPRGAYGYHGPHNGPEFRRSSSFERHLQRERGKER